MKKKILFCFATIIVILTIIEFIKYLTFNSTVFGLVYMMLNTIIILLLIPTTFNYNEKYSLQRISKLFFIFVIGMFLSYLLGYIVVHSLKYMDYSNEYIKSIFIIKNIIKPILYFAILIFDFTETKLYLRLIKTYNHKVKSRLKK